MQAPPLQWLSRLGRLEKSLLALLALYFVFTFIRPESTLGSVAMLLALITAMLLVFRLARRGMQKLIWRLRNRLMVVYLVNTELNRRTTGLMGTVEALVRTRTSGSEEMVNRIAPLIRYRFPAFQLLVDGEDQLRFPRDSDLQSPPPEWKPVSGLVL